MAYTKQNFTDGQILTAEQLNQIEDGIVDLEKVLSGSESPIKYVESTDTENLLNLRDFESGTYVLYGKFHPYSGSTASISFSNALLVNIITKTAGTHVQVFYPVNNCVQFLNITDDSYERTNVYLNDLLEAIGTLSGLTTTDKTNLVAAINEVAGKGSGVWYGTTSTAPNTAEKVVTTVTGNFELEKGARLGVKFLTNTVNCNSLIVDGTAQTYIRSINDEAGNSDTSAPIVWHNLGQVQWFTYDGEYFIIEDSIRATAENSLCGKVAVSNSVSSTGNTVASSTAVKTAYDKAVTNSNSIGTLSNLTTTDKSSLVAAINELAAKINA